MLTDETNMMTRDEAISRLEMADAVQGDLYRAVRDGRPIDPVLVELIRAAACTVRGARLDTAPGLGETSPFAAALSTVATACRKIEASDRPAFWLGMIDRALALAIGALRTTEDTRA